MDHEKVFTPRRLAPPFAAPWVDEKGGTSDNFIFTSQQNANSGLVELSLQLNSPGHSEEGFDGIVGFCWGGWTQSISVLKNARIRAQIRTERNSLGNTHISPLVQCIHSYFLVIDGLGGRVQSQLFAPDSGSKSFNLLAPVEGVVNLTASMVIEMRYQSPKEAFNSFQCEFVGAFEEIHVDNRTAVGTPVQGPVAASAPPFLQV